MLGRFTVTYQVEVDLPTSMGIGSATFKSGPNGEAFSLSLSDRGNPTQDPDVSFIVERTPLQAVRVDSLRHGSFTVHRLLTWSRDTTGSFDGNHRDSLSKVTLQCGDS